MTNQTILNHNGIGCTRDASGAFSVNYRSLGENVAIQIKLSSEELSINFTSLIGFWYSQNINYNVSENTCTLGCDLFIQVTNSSYECIMNVLLVYMHRSFQLILLLLAAL